MLGVDFKISEAAKILDSADISQLIADTDSDLPLANAGSTFAETNEKIDAAVNKLSESLAQISEKPFGLGTFHYEAAYSAMTSLDKFEEVNIALDSPFIKEISDQTNYAKNNIESDVDYYRHFFDYNHPLSDRFPIHHIAHEENR